MNLSSLVSLARHFDADTIHNIARFGGHLADRIPFERRRSTASRIASATGFVLAGATLGAFAVVVVNAINPALLRSATKTLRSAKDGAEEAFAAATHTLQERLEPAAKEKSANGDLSASS